MKDKLNQFILNLQGQFVEVSSREAIYQCMDLTYAWVFCLGYPKETIQNQYAYQVWTNPKDITRQYFDLLPNTATFIPQDGDIAVYDKTASNIAGHIGVALGGGTITQFRCFEQNYPVGTNALVRLRNYNTPKLLGVLRPKVFDTLVITDQTRIPQIGNQEVQAIRGTIGDKDRKIAELDLRIISIKGKLTSGVTQLRELANIFEN